MNDRGPSPAGTAPNAPQRDHGFAVSPPLHVLLVCMTQVCVILFSIIPVQALYERGVNWVLLAAGTAATLVGIHFLIGIIARLLPARCKHCRQPSQYRGTGWWPFTYRYACNHCGQEMRFEVRG